MNSAVDEARFTPHVPGADLRLVRYAPLSEHVRHCHDTTSITLILSGALEESAAPGTRRSGVCSVVVKPADIYHSDIYGPRGTRTLQLTLRPDSREKLGEIGPYRWHDGGPVAKSMLAMLNLGRSGALDDEATLDDCLIDLFACIAETDPRGCDRVRPAWMNDLAQQLRETCSDTVSIRDLAGSAQVHPVSLARAFRRHHGCSISEYIRRQRVLKACDLMEEGAYRLAEIALATGFSDQPHFTRAFRAETGLAPARFRRTVS